MDIYFKTKKLERVCSKKSLMVKALGEECSRKLQQRMSELWAADSLSDISHLRPTRLHALTGNRKGQFSVDLKHPYRLLFIASDDPVPYLDDGGIDKQRVLSVEIVEICDTHG